MFKHFVNLRNATIKIQISRENLARVLKHFGQVGQLRLYSGELYCQGHGWYLAILNEDALAPEVAARRFLDCLRVALRNGASVEQSKKMHADLEKEVADFLRVRQRRVVTVSHLKDHGRTVGVARSHVVSAFANRDAVLTQAIKALEAKIPDPKYTPPAVVRTPASATSLSALAAKFSR